MAKDKSRQDYWIVKGQEAVEAKRKDPSSAQFRHLFFHLAKLKEAMLPSLVGR
jgi:hypothetical protein